MLNLKQFKYAAKRIGQQYNEDFDFDNEEELIRLRTLVLSLVKASLHNEPSDDPEDSPTERLEDVLHCFFDPQVKSDGFAELAYLATLPHFAK